MIENYLSEKQKRRKKKRTYLSLCIGLFAAYFLLLGFFWVAARSPFFLVSAVIVKGNQNVAADDITTLLRSSALRNYNYAFVKALLGFRSMFTWPDEVGPDDLKFIPQLASIRVAKDYIARTITATVAERAPFAIWCLMPRTDASGRSVSDEQCYWFDEQGTVFERTFDTQGSLMFAIHDYSRTKLGLNQKVLPDAFTLNLISIINALKESRIDAKEIALNDLGLEEIDIATYNGPSLYFSLRFSAENDGRVLKDLMSKPGFSKLQYVDFRIENRAYYK